MKAGMLIGIVLAVICLALAVDYAIPNTPHLFADSARHLKHAAVFVALAVIALIGGRFAANSAKAA